MHLSYILVLVAATILSSCDAASAATTSGNSNQVEKFDGKSGTTFLRGLRGDEERTLNVDSLLKLLKLKKTPANVAVVDDFAKTTSDKVQAFERKMFKEWSTGEHNKEKIKKMLDIKKR
jgi:hypothetical protein